MQLGKIIGFFLIMHGFASYGQSFPNFYVVGSDTNVVSVNVCRGYQITFSNITPFSDSLFWSFPGGLPASSSASTANVSWANNGSYIVTLDVYNSFGVITTSTINVIVSSSKPSVTLPTSLGTICSSDPPFTPAFGIPANGFWIGPSVVNNQVDPALSALGNNTVGYYVRGANGCFSDTLFTTYNVIEGPTAVLFNPSNFQNCDGFSPVTPTFLLDLTNFSTAPPGQTIVNYEIYWGDGTPFWSATAFPTTGLQHTYGGQGVFNLVFVVTSSNGCTDTATYQVANTTNPSSLTIINPGGTNGCSPVTVTFPLSTNNTDPSITYTINFGDGRPPISFNHPPPSSITYTFDTTSCLQPSQFFNIVATATNACLSTVSSVQGPFVTQPAIAMFTPPVPGGCVGQPTTFANMSIPGYNNACNRLSLFTWDFGDGSPPVTVPSNTPQPPPGIHTYTQPGIYTVTLWVESGGALCPGDTFQDIVCIGEGPAAIASANNLVNCVPFNVSPQNNSVIHTYCDTASYSWTVTPATGWQLRNNTTLSDFEPEFRFTQAGNYTLKLFIDNHCGEDSAVFNVVAQGNPIVDFPTVVNFCDTATLDFMPGSLFAPFISSPNTPITSFDWSVSPNNFSLVSGNLNDSGFVGQFVPGVYTVYLTATNACGSTTDSVTFSVAILTEGGFEIDTTAGCSPLTVNVTSTSAQLATHEWYVNGVLYSTALDTSMTFVNPSFSADSVIDVVLIVFSGPNCADTITAMVTVYANPNPNFSAAPVCVGSTTSFYDSTQVASAPVLTRNWNFGDGNFSTTINPTHQYANPGIYNVSLTITDTNDCSFSVVKPVIVGDEPLVDFQISYASQPDSACVGDTIFFINQTTAAPFGFPIASYEWDLNNNNVINSNATNYWAIFNNSGSYQVRLRAVDSLGCSAELVKNIHISEPPVAGITLSQQLGCTPLQITATNATQGYATNFNWEFYTLNSNNTKNILYTASQSDPNPIPPFVAPGTSTTAVYVKLVASNSCYSDSIFDTISVRPLPIPFFQLSQDTGCSPFLATIQTDGFVTGQPDSILFNFGDGSPQQLLHPTINTLPNGDTLFTWNQRTHLFLYNGNAADTTYFITLRAINECGDSTYTLPIVVRSRSVQSFFQTNTPIGCAPFTLNVVDGSFAATNISYCFDYDTISGTCNGSVLGAPNGTYTFTSFGTFVVSQFVNNDCGFDTSWVAVQVRPTPNPDFIFPASICANQSFTIQNTSTINLGLITGYQWDFGDGTTSLATNPTHAYSVPGTYTICLTASSAIGCDTTFCQNIIVNNVPVADFEFVTNSLCLNEQPVSFINYSFDSLNNISSYLWDFGDGNTSLAVNPFHSYAVAGTYNVKLIVANVLGCTDSIIKTVEIRPVPQAAFSFRILSGDTCGVPQQVEFTNNSNGAFGYFWDFNSVNAPGQLTSTLTHPTFTFSQPGTYKIRLIAQNGQGCTDTAIQEIRIHPIPEVDFSVLAFSGCAPHKAEFINLTTLPPGFADQLSYRWYFGDGGTSASQIPIYVFQQPGTFWVALAVESEFGCYDSLFIDNFITVYDLPEPRFTSEILEFGLFDFTSSVIGGAPGYSYFWDFDDGQTTFEPNPRHRFNIQAVNMALGYKVCLTVTDANGCAKEYCDTLDVGMFTLFIPNAMAPDAFGEGALFLPKGQGLEEYHLQIFDRWGNRIWETSALDSETASPLEGWDGTIEGQPVPIGVYVWRIDAKFANGKIWIGTNYNDQLGTNTGTITIVR